MEIKVLGCSGGRTPEQDLTCYLIDDSLLIDTGAAGGFLTLEQQETISDVLVTHSHLDHILGLAFIGDNTRLSRNRPIDVYAAEPTIKTIKDHLFAPEVMPFLLPGPGEPALFNFHAIELDLPFVVGPYEVEAFPVFHMPGAVAYRVSDNEHTMMFTGDTGPTDRIWRWLKERGGVDCLIAEASFPNRMEELAFISRHLTPQTLAESLGKAGYGPDDMVHVVHIKPSFRDDMIEELAAEKDYQMVALKEGKVIKLEKGASGPQILQMEVEEKVGGKSPEFDSHSDLYDQRDRLTKDFGVSVSAGETIFNQGDESRIMYVIQKGSVRIYRQAWGMEQTLSVIGPGDFFGEMAMLNNRARTATTIALTEVKLLAFDRAAFEQLIVNNFGVALRIIHTLAQRIQDADTLIETMLYIDPQSKVVNTIINAAYDEGIETNEGFLVRISPEKLSDRSGVVIGTLRDILTDLVNENMVILRREAVIIPDVRKLKRLLKFLELKDEFT